MRRRTRTSRSVRFTRDLHARRTPVAENVKTAPKAQKTQGLQDANETLRLALMRAGRVRQIELHKLDADTESRVQDLERKAFVRALDDQRAAMDAGPAESGRMDAAFRAQEERVRDSAAARDKLRDEYQEATKAVFDREDDARHAAWQGWLAALKDYVAAIDAAKVDDAALRAIRADIQSI